MHDVYRRVRERRSLQRSVLVLGDSWFAVAPVLLLGLAGAHAFDWSDWPMFCAAIAMQVGVNALAGGTRKRLHSGAWPALHDVLWLPATIDVTLTVPALTAVAVANDAPVAAALSTVALLVIARGFTSERRGRLVEHHHATHDPLTGLANRLLLDELADAASERARREQHSCGLLLADLDAFKAINDSHGHAAGDQVLVGAAARLRARVRAVDTVARVGGDEFAVLLSGAQTQETCAQVARELRAAIAVPFDLPGGPYEVGVSIGYALLDGDRSLADALREADGAMYAVKPATAPRRDPTRPLAGEAQRA